MNVVGLAITHGLDRMSAWLRGSAPPDKSAGEPPPAREQLEGAVDEAIRRMGLSLDMRETCEWLTRGLSENGGEIDFRHLAGDIIFLLADPEVIAALQRTSVERVGEPGLHTVSLPDAIPQRLVRAILEALKQVPGLQHLEVEKLDDVMEMHGPVWLLKNDVESIQTVAPRELAGDGRRESLVLHRDGFGNFHFPVKGSKPSPLRTGDPAVDALIAKLPKLVDDLATLKRAGWTLKLGRAGGGNWTSRGQRVIFLDPLTLDRPVSAVRGLAHEMGPYVLSPVPGRFSADRSLADEAGKRYEWVIMGN